MRVWLRPAFWPTLLFLMAVLVRVSALGAPFVFDDFRVVVENPSLRDLSNWRFLFLYERFRPVLNLSYALDVALWGLAPFGFHLTNVLLHGVNVLLWRRFLLATGATSAVALVASVLFAVHPVLTEAVVYVSSRSELLAATFVLSALNLLAAYRTHARRWQLVAALVAVVLAFATKESSAGLLLVGAPLLPKRLRLPGAVLAAVIGCILVWRVRLYVGQEAAFEVDHWPHNFLVQIEVLWRYLGLLVVPVGLSLVHSVAELPTLAAPGHWLLLCLTLAIIAAAILLRRRHPWLFSSVLWFIAFWLPSSLVPLAEVMSEHRIYLASAGFFGAVANLAQLLPQRLMTLATAALAVVFAAGSLSRNEVWRDQLALARDAATKSPNVAFAQAATAREAQRRNDCALAVQYYERALALVPDQVEERLQLGICLAKEHRYKEARVALETVLTLAPNNVRAHNNLGMLEAVEGQPKRARAHFDRVLELEPNNSFARRVVAGMPASLPSRE